jgi:hypothetical protein
MVPPGRPKGESGARSARVPMVPPGRPKGESLSASAKGVQ